MIDKNKLPTYTRNKKVRAVKIKDIESTGRGLGRVIPADAGVVPFEVHWNDIKDNWKPGDYIVVHNSGAMTFWSEKTFKDNHTPIKEK